LTTDVAGRDAIAYESHYDAGTGDECIIARTSRLLAFTTTLGEVFTTEAVAEAVLEFGSGVVEATHGFFATVAGSRLTMVAASGGVVTSGRTTDTSACVGTGPK
jgi:hypothetical protein